MLKKYMARLEDPNHPLLGPTLWGLKSWGMWQPNSGLNSIIYNLIHLFAILFVVSQYVELWFIRTNLELALRNLSVTMLSTVCVVKAGTFVLWQKYWRDVIHFVSSLEKSQLEKKDKTTSSIIADYTKYSNTVTYFYWSLVTATVFTVILAPLGVYVSSAEQRQQMKNGTIPYPEIMSSWVPFDKTKRFGYWFQILEHTIICFYGGGIVANFDSNTVALMSFFSGQLELLVANCKRLFGENNELVSDSEAMERIKQCHSHHSSLIKHARILNSLLSPVMFLYVIICSLMICASAILLTQSTTKIYIDNVTKRCTHDIRTAKSWIHFLAECLYRYLLTVVFGQSVKDIYFKIDLQDSTRTYIADTFKYSLVPCKLKTSLSKELKEGTTAMQRMWVAEYLAALIAQLFLFCWHSNEVYFMIQEMLFWGEDYILEMAPGQHVKPLALAFDGDAEELSLPTIQDSLVKVSSERVDRGVYESDWWRYGARLRRSVLLLGGQLRKTIVFEAGPFTKLTIATFVAILKGSYSYYTLLSNNEG